MDKLSNFSLSLISPLGYLASNSINNQKKEHFSIDKETSDGITMLVWVILTILAIYIHLTCNKKIGLGIIPAFFCPGCYLLIYLIQSCPAHD